MDYTLAQYTRHFDELTFQEALKKLVYDLGYPEVCTPGTTTRQIYIYLLDELLFNHSHSVCTLPFIFRIYYHLSTPTISSQEVLSLIKRTVISSKWISIDTLEKLFMVVVNSTQNRCSLCRHSDRVRYCL